MEQLKFKTTLKCSGCVEKVTPHLNEAAGQGNWEVDLTNPSRILTITANGNEAKIKEAMEKAGYKAERL
jgi:copper chaperone